MSRAISADREDAFQEGVTLQPELGEQDDPDVVAAQNAREADHARRVMEATTDGILIIDRSGNCEYLNPAAQQLLGWGLQEMEARPVHSVLHPTCQNQRCILRRTFTDALPQREDEEHFATRWGTHLPVAVRVSPSVMEGVVDSVVCLFADATQQIRRRRAQQEALEAKEAAIRQQAELNEQRTDFVFTVSHELRTPLTSIMGFLDLVMEDETLAGETRENLTIVSRNATRLLAQVEALLLVSRIEAGKIVANMTTVNIADVIEDVTSTVRPQTETKRITLDVGAVDPTLAVRADASQLDRVMLNLLSNAIKFTPEGGTVAVSVSTTPKWVQIQVRDTGMGIPAAEQSRLFEKFFRSSISQKRATPGTGLGLAIVKAIIEEHGGKVGTTSKEGVGTAVAFTLPRTA